MRLFVSYTLRDGEITPMQLRRLSRILKAEGHTVFIDYLDNDSTEKQLRVINELLHCDKIMLLQTRMVKDSEWVALELAYARLYHKQVIPCRISNNTLIRYNEYA